MRFFVLGTLLVLRFRNVAFRATTQLTFDRIATRFAGNKHTLTGVDFNGAFDFIAVTRALVSPKLPLGISGAR
jgi:hypothetical protein